MLFAWWSQTVTTMCTVLSNWCKLKVNRLRLQLKSLHWHQVFMDSIFTSLEISSKDANLLDHTTIHLARNTEDLIWRKDTLEISVMWLQEKTESPSMRVLTNSFNYMESTASLEDHALSTLTKMISDKVAMNCLKQLAMLEPVLLAASLPSQHHSDTPN